MKETKFFFLKLKLSCDRFYEMPETKSKRAAGIGYA